MFFRSLFKLFHSPIHVCKITVHINKTGVGDILVALPKTFIQFIIPIFFSLRQLGSIQGYFKAWLSGSQTFCVSRGLDFSIHLDNLGGVQQFASGRVNCH